MESMEMQEGIKSKEKLNMWVNLHKDEQKH